MQWDTFYFDPSNPLHYEELRERMPRGEQYRKLEKPKPPTDYYHYSNERSQGALICKTAEFRHWYDTETEVISCAYSDRIAQWDRKRYEDACEIAGGEDCVWAFNLPSLSDEKLREFAMVALGLKKLPLHVEVVHYFNVSNGYSCPVVLAISSKE